MRFVTASLALTVSVFMVKGNTLLKEQEIPMEIWSLMRKTSSQNGPSQSVATVGKPTLVEEPKKFKTQEKEFKAPLYLMSEQSAPPTCTAEYAALAVSTMCNYWANSQVDLSLSGLSADDEELVTNLHNSLRSKVGIYPGANSQPHGADIVKMYYDEKIAKIAQHYANTCPSYHDTGDERKVPGYGISIGQNLAWGYSDWTAAIQAAWYDEVFEYLYGVNPDTYVQGDIQIGHYTQMVHAPSIRLGCGYAYCPHPTIAGYTWRTYVCNYAHGQTSYQWPYSSGDACGKCPDNCEDSLCDCGDKICFNGGTLELATCSCQCETIYTGESCETLTCPDRDPDRCGVDWPKSYCIEYAGNVPYECPYMCENCPGTTTTRLDTTTTSSGGGYGDDGGGSAPGNITLVTVVALAMTALLRTS